MVRILKKAAFRRGVEAVYEKLVLVIMKLMGKKTTTDNVELMQAGKQLLGDKFAGVYSSDQRPALSKKRPYAVLNTKPTASGGEHWIALARMPPSGKLMHYDSFGRLHRQLFPDRWEDEAVDTELDVEQDERTSECGQRSLAWLLLFDRPRTELFAVNMVYLNTICTNTTAIAMRKIQYISSSV